MLLRNKRIYVGHWIHTYVGEYGLSLASLDAMASYSTFGSLL